MERSIDYYYRTYRFESFNRGLSSLSIAVVATRLFSTGGPYPRQFAIIPFYVMVATNLRLIHSIE